MLAAHILKTDLFILICLAFVKLGLHLITNGGYGYHVDELYYLAAGEHLDWGYTEFPPLIALAAKGSRWLWGDSLRAIRLLPAIAGALLVFVTGLITRELGGGRFAQGLAAVVIIAAPYYLFMHTILTMNAFEPLIWAFCAYLLILLIKTQSPRFWLLIGLVTGIGLLNKYSIVFFSFSIIVGLLITDRFRFFKTSWFYGGVAIAVIMVLPNVLWQYQHGWPFLEQQAAASLFDKKPWSTSALDLLIQPILFMNPLSFPIWATGLYYYLGTRQGRPYKFFGWAYVVMFGTFLILAGRYYYLAPFYPILLASGAIVLEGWVNRQKYFKYLRTLIFSLLSAGTVVMLPMVIPVLPLRTFLRISSLYSSLYTLPNSASNAFDQQEAPLHFREMLGWEELVSQVNREYQKLRPEEQAQTAILAWGYGSAGAIDLFGPAYGLPRVISGAHNFYFWGPRDYSGEIVLSIGGDRTHLQTLFGSVEPVGAVKASNILGVTEDLPIYLCRGIKGSLQQNWPLFKTYFRRVYLP